MSKKRIIESLEYCRKNQKSNDCESCEYGGRSFQICERLVDDILVLLKEQEAVVRCKDCKYATMTDDGKTCRICAIYTDGFGDPRYVFRNANWFCADGERKEGR